MKKLIFLCLVYSFWEYSMEQVQQACVTVHDIQEVRDACYALEACVHMSCCNPRLKAVLGQKMFMEGAMWPLSCIAESLAEKVEDHSEQKKQIAALAKLWRESCEKSYHAKKTEPHAPADERANLSGGGESGVVCKGTDSSAVVLEKQAAPKDLDEHIVDLVYAIPLAAWLREQANMIINESRKKRAAIDHSLIHNERL
jgi:Fe-S cluster biosynthesis and repair protein YggX